MLKAVFGLDHFHHMFGCFVTLVTDHKPLVAISKKPLSKAPNRLQSFLLRIQNYNLDLVYMPGTSIPVAVTLLRAPLPDQLRLLMWTTYLLCLAKTNTRMNQDCDIGRHSHSTEIYYNEGYRDRAVFQLQRWVVTKMKHHFACHCCDQRQGKTLHWRKIIEFQQILGFQW